MFLQLISCFPLSPKVEWADLATIDMTHAGTAEGRKALVKQVHDAIKNEGFLYVVNHGLTEEQVCFFSALAALRAHQNTDSGRPQECLTWQIILSKMFLKKKNKNIWEK